MTRVVRNLNLSEIAVLLDWAAIEGWNPGLDDAIPFQAADPKGFFGAFVDGTMVAGISAVAYDADFGFIGLYICHPDWRGQGHGKAVWDAGLAYLGSRTIGLDGVPEQQANYASMGFVSAYETIRMSGTLPIRRIDPRHEEAPRPDEIYQLDRQCFPAARDAFLRHWLMHPRKALTHRTSSIVDGYAVSRQCGDGLKVGPLFAQTLDVAIELFVAHSGRVHIDVPAKQVAWLTALTGLGFREGFSTSRMYKGRVPSTRQTAIFGISSLELG